MMVNDKPKIGDTSKFSSKEASEILGISRRSLINYVNDNRIKFHISRINGRKYFKGIDIKMFWESAI